MTLVLYVSDCQVLCAVYASESYAFSYYTFYLDASSINIPEPVRFVIINVTIFVNDDQSLYLKCCLRIFGPKAEGIRRSGWFSHITASMCICEWAFMACRFCFSREGKRKIREKSDKATLSTHLQEERPHLISFFRFRPRSSSPACLGKCHCLSVLCTEI